MMKKGYLIGLIFILVSCSDSQKKTVAYRKIHGETMGTTYSITYKDILNKDFKKEIDQRLIELNNEVSTYIKTSIISKVNQAKDSLMISNTHHYFLDNYLKAKEIYEKTNHYLDVSIMPIVNYWGFGYTEKRKVTKIDSVKIKSLMQDMGLYKWKLKQGKDSFVIYKPSPTAQLDFSSLAKGYGVDEIGRLLVSKGVNDFVIDIGGEDLAKGLSPRNSPWNIGISMPKENAAYTDVFSVVELKNKAIATSGNYRIFYESNGQKFSHIINPMTGFPERSNLLGASVITDDCMTADAYATAFMAMGLEKAIQLAEKTKGIEAYLIYVDENGELKTKFTDGVKKFLLKDDETMK